MYVPVLIFLCVGLPLLHQDLDSALGPTGFGLAMGPFEMADLAGNDIGYYVRAYILLVHSRKLVKE